MSKQTLQGQFWLAEQPDQQLPGEVDFVSGLLTVEGELVSSMVVVHQALEHVELTLREDSDVTYHLFGRLADGAELTLPQCVRGGGNGSSQDWLFLRALVGAYVPARDEFTAATITFDEPWASEVAYASFTADLETPPYRTQLETAEDGSLHFGDLANLALADVERYLLDPLRSLLMLLGGTPVEPGLVLTLRDDSDVTLHWKRDHRPFKKSSREIAVPLRALGTDGLQAWYRLNQQVVPGPTLVAKTVVGQLDVEMKILILAAVAEGLHRKLYDVKKMTKGEAKGIRNAAVAAVPPEMQKRVEALLGPLRSLSYPERLHLLVNRLDVLASDLAGAVVTADPEQADQMGSSASSGRDLWVHEVTDARNGFAHLRPHSPADLDQWAGRMFTLYESLRWTLTGVLLLHVGVPLEIIKEGFQQCSGYRLFRGRALDRWPNIYS